MTLDSSLRVLALGQRGVLTTEQAMLHGATESMLRHRVRSGSLVRLAPRVFAIGGVPVTRDVLLYAAWLECGGRSAISHATAAAHWRFPGFRTKPIQLVRLRDGTFPPVSLGRVHTTRELPDTQVVDVDGMFVTSPARTLFDLAPIVPRGRLERLLDRAWSHRLVNWWIMQRTFRELQRRGRPGIAAMRELLDARPIDFVPTASSLEMRFHQIVRDDGQAPLDRQINLGDQVRWIGRVDFFDRAARVIVEVQSDVHHTSVSDRASDAERRKALVDAGWQFVEVTEHEVWHQPDVVSRRVRTARRGLAPAG
jgi:very-short-patch-repair endonuclease